MEHLTDEELIAFYWEISEKFLKCAHWKRNPHKRAKHEAYMELIRRGFK